MFLGFRVVEALEVYKCMLQHQGPWGKSKNKEQNGRCLGNVSS
jgi:hypothetical protein